MGTGSRCAETEDAAGVCDDLLMALELAQPQIERILSAHRIPAEDAEDLLHDALTRYLDSSEPISEPVGWLVATVKYASLMYWRKRRRRVVEQLDDAIAENLVANDCPLEARLGLSADLARHLERVGAKCRRLLRLRYGLGFDPNELADELGYRLDSVHRVTRRCLDSMADRMSRAGYDPLEWTFDG